MDRNADVLHARVSRNGLNAHVSCQPPDSWNSRSGAFPVFLIPPPPFLPQSERLLISSAWKTRLAQSRTQSVSAAAGRSRQPAPPVQPDRPLKVRLSPPETHAFRSSRASRPLDRYEARCPRATLSSASVTCSSTVLNEDGIPCGLRRSMADVCLHTGDVELPARSG